MKLTFQLRHSTAERGTPQAVFLRGSSAEDWLIEISRWPVDQNLVRIYPVAGGQVGSLRGALIILPAKVKPSAATLGSAADNPYAVARRPAADMFGIHLRELEGGLYVPVDAELDPEPLAKELQQQTPDDESIYLWLPGEQLYRCDSIARLSVHQLIALPPPEKVAWDQAVAGDMLNRRLFAIEAEAPHGAEQFLEAARDDIGVDSPQLDSLPQAPGEMTAFRLLRPLWIVVIVVALAVLAVWLLIRTGAATDLLAILGVAALIIGMIIFLSWLMNRFQQVAQSLGNRWGAGRRAAASRAGGQRQASSGAAGAGGWLAQQLANLNQNLQALRNREIERLMKMLESRPDEGLRYAIPLGAVNAYRGLAMPGFQLLARVADFNMTRLFAGGRADFWSLDADYSARLAKRYRELANREIALGRHRRAAYIFAELLGDLRSAAVTLADGGYYQEAAVLYRERLHDLPSAAECLERGGLLLPAIECYGQCNNFEKVGDLYARLGQTEPAEAGYRRAVDARRAQADMLAAARLLEQKLNQPEEALDLLFHTWHQSHWASNCLEEAFRLLARMNQHDRAIRQVREASERAPTQDAALKVARCLVGLAHKYPDARVKAVAADQTRRLFSRWVERAGNDQQRELVELVGKLVPDDRLLDRDCYRFVETRSGTVAKSRARGVRMLAEFQLPAAEWQSVVEFGREFYAVGRNDDRVVLARGYWNGTIQISSANPWRIKPGCDGSLQCGIGHFDHSQLFVHQSQASPFEVYRAFAADGHFSNRDAGRHPAFTADDTFAWHVRSPFLLCVNISAESGPVIETHDLAERRLHSTRSISFPPTTLDAMAQAEFEMAPVFTFHAGICFIGGRHGLLVVERVGERANASLVHLFETVRHFSTSSGKSTSLAACFETGGRIWWSDPRLGPTAAFGKDLHHPVAGFLRNDVMAVADSSRVEFYSTTDWAVKLIGEADGTGEQPIAVCRMPHASQVAVFTSNGRIRTYSL